MKSIELEGYIEVKESVISKVFYWIGIALFAISGFIIALVYISLAYQHGFEKLVFTVSPYNLFTYLDIFLMMAPAMFFIVLATITSKKVPLEGINWTIKIWLAIVVPSLIIWQIGVIYYEGFNILQNIMNPFNLAYYLPVFIIIFSPILLTYSISNVIIRIWLNRNPDSQAIKNIELCSGRIKKIMQKAKINQEINTFDSSPEGH